MTRRDFLRVAAAALLPHAEVEKPVLTGLGVGLPWQHAEADEDYYQRALGTLMPPWWYSWKFDAIDFIFPPFLPMVWAMKADGAANQAVTAAGYGPRLWLLGNEPERADQSNTSPETAALFSLWWRGTAQGEWAGPGVLIGLPAAYDWLDAYLAAGGAIPDAWAVHNYGWTADQWDNNLGPFLLWMQRRGVAKPVIVTECASWDRSLPAQQAIMRRVRTAIEQGNIQAACWYSSRDPFGPFRGADLLTAEGELTPLGEQYVDGAEPPPQPVPESQVHLPVIFG